MSQSIRPLLFKSIGLYSLFLIPTLLLITYTGFADSGLSQAIGGTWQAEFWNFPGLGEVASRVLLDILEAIAIALIGGLFYQGFQTIQQSSTDAPKKLVMLWTILASGILVFVTPFHSSDIFGYLNRGFQQSAFHTNPYLTTIGEIPGWQNSHLLHAHWIDNPCPYGFFFAQLTQWLTQLANASFTNAYLIFKALNLALVTGTTLLIAQITRKLNFSKPWLAAYLFGANPLVLLHVMGNGHNDILMVFLLLLSVACMQSKRVQWLCLPILTISILSKYASLLALPFILIYLLKRKHYHALLTGGLLSLLLLGGLAYSYIDPNQKWPWNALLDNAGKPQHSIISMLAELVYYPLKWAGFHAQKITDQALQLLKPIFWLGFIGFYGYRLWKFLKAQTTPEGLLYEIALTSTVMVAFISAKFHPWYPIMFLPLTLLLPESSRLRQFSLIFCLFQLAGFTIFQNLPIVSEALLTLVPVWLAYQRYPLFKANA
jgi:hypothetical protein